MKHTDWKKKDVSIVGLCQYPLKEWRDLERPFFTTYGWWFFAMVMMLGARDANQATSTLKLLWTAREKGRTDYVLSKSERRWAAEGPHLPQTLDAFRKQYVNACTGFFADADAHDPDQGRFVGSPFEGPVGFGTKVNVATKQEYSRLLKKTESKLKVLNLSADGTSTSSTTN